MNVNAAFMGEPLSPSQPVPHALHLGAVLLTGPVPGLAPVPNPERRTPQPSAASSLGGQSI